jgi:hypothetical protein
MNRVLHGVRATKLRAALLQTMLALLDHEDERGLQGVLAVLHALAALPLDDPRERARCLACLRALDRRRSVTRRRQSVDSDGDSDAFGSDGDDEREVDIDELDSELDAPPSSSPSAFRVSSDTTSMPPSFVYESPSALSPEPARRESGRAKGVSLRHCRAFLLACANEIHELDAEDPAFDYAEDTASEAATLLLHLRPAPGSILHDAVPAPMRFKTFDYASTAADATSVATNDLSFRLRDDDDESNDSSVDDDLEADQGSQLSEVLYRAEFLTDDDQDDDDQDDDDQVHRRASHSSFLGRYSHPPDAFEVDSALSRRVLTAWRRHTAAKTSPAALAVKLRAFRALQRARGLSVLSLARKRRAFRSLRLPPASYRLFPASKPVEKQQPSLSAAVATQVLQAVAVPRADTLVLLLLAVLFHAAASL